MSDRREDPRVEELLRVNAELAAEVRNLTLGYSDAPRPAGMPTTRRLGRLIEERDQLQAELEDARKELEDSARHRGELEQRQAELVAEIAELRIGIRGVLRRLRARLLR
jgi:chromosome segregation ATPase